MRTFPNAKINLGLHIVSKRADGYHNLETVFYPVGIRDSLQIENADHTFCEISGTGIPGEPAENLCVKAFHLLAADFNITPQRILLTKNIPVGAGLGGGSSDAAFMLKMLNEKFSLSLNTSDLEKYAARLGADCAFFIKNEPAFAFARGDELKPQRISLAGYKIHLVMPKVHISTREAYSGVIPKSPSVDLTEAVAKPVESWKDLIVNDFEISVFKTYPAVAELKQSLYDQGAVFAQMSGSGASVFGLFRDESPLNIPDGYRAFYNI